MSEGVIEHVNISVSDPDRSAARLAAIFGWSTRWSGRSASGGRVAHVGWSGGYVAVHEGATARHAKGAPLNHIGVEVDDLDACERRVVAQGFKPFSHGDYEPGRRFYFFDDDGVEYEVVSYAPKR